MKQETIELRKLTAADGMVLYNGETLGKEVYLGKNDSPENWKEIADEEAETIRQDNLAAASNDFTDPVQFKGGAFVEG